MLEHNGLKIHFRYTPGSPGKLYGPPENCYPAEPAEVEILGWEFSDAQEFQDETGIFPLKGLVEIYLRSAEIGELIYEHAEDDELARYEAAMEDRAEAMWEDAWYDDLPSTWEPEY